MEARTYTSPVVSTEHATRRTSIRMRSGRVFRELQWDTTRYQLCGRTFCGRGCVRVNMNWGETLRGSKGLVLLEERVKPSTYRASPGYRRHSGARASSHRVSANVNRLRPMPPPPAVGLFRFLGLLATTREHDEAFMATYSG